MIAGYSQYTVSHLDGVLVGTCHSVSHEEAARCCLERVNYRGAKVCKVRVVRDDGVSKVVCVGITEQRHYSYKVIQ